MLRHADADESAAAATLIATIAAGHLHYATHADAIMMLYKICRRHTLC